MGTAWKGAPAGMRVGWYLLACTTRVAAAPVVQVACTGRRRDTRNLCSGRPRALPCTKGHSPCDRTWARAWAREAWCLVSAELALATDGGRLVRGALLCKEHTEMWLGVEGSVVFKRFASKPLYPLHLPDFSLFGHRQGEGSLSSLSSSSSSSPSSWSSWSFSSPSSQCGRRAQRPWSL